jgi:hypothetical protein
MAAEFTLTVSGSPAMLFRGECRMVERLGSVEHVRLRGSIPVRHKFETAALSCTIVKWDARGRLVVSLKEGGNVLARAETGAAFNWVRVRSDGPWGRAGGKRGVRRLPVLPDDPPRGTVPPHTSPTVPPHTSPKVPPLRSTE